MRPCPKLFRTLHFECAAASTSVKLLPSFLMWTGDVGYLVPFAKGLPLSGNDLMLRYRH